MQQQLAQDDVTKEIEWPVEAHRSLIKLICGQQSMFFFELLDYHYAS